MIKTYEDLDIYKDSYRLALEIYKITKIFPKDEIYGLTSQIRRAAISIALNIAEGYGRLSRDEFKRFLKISLGSTNETMALINFSKDLKLIQLQQYNIIIKEYDNLGKKIYNTIKKWN